MESEKTYCISVPIRPKNIGDCGCIGGEHIVIVQRLKKNRGDGKTGVLKTLRAKCLLLFTLP